MVDVPPFEGKIKGPLGSRLVFSLTGLNLTRGSEAAWRHRGEPESTVSKNMSPPRAVEGSVCSSLIRLLVPTERLNIQIYNMCFHCRNTGPKGKKKLLQIMCGGKRHLRRHSRNSACVLFQPLKNQPCVSAVRNVITL